MEKIESLLKMFELTDYEIKAYLTLLKLKVATADQISELGAIPLPRVYDTLVELQRKGFVLISKDRPKKFKVIGTEKTFYNLIEIKKYNFESKIKNLNSVIKEILKYVNEIKPLEANVKEIGAWYTEKRKNVVESLNDQLNIAKKEVLSFAGDVSWLSETMNSIRNAIKRGVEIRIIAKEIDTSKEFLKNLSKAKKLGLKIKHGYNGHLRGYIIDGKVASLAFKTSESGVNVSEEGKPKSDIDRKYELIIIENQPIAAALKENFEFWWNKLS
jgi:sugar-specific transcriptional regulator TrmB